MKNTPITICLSHLKQPIIYIIFIICILNPISLKNGTSIGINLVLTTILPTLLPFIILSNIMMSLNSFDIFKNNKYICMFVGFICGYPMGAKVTTDFYNSGKILRNDAEHIIGVCNTLSPAFIISYLSGYVLNNEYNNILILIIIYTSAFLCNYTTRLIGIYNNTQGVFPLTCESKEIKEIGICNNIDETLIKSFVQIAKLSAYVIIFSIINTLITDNIKLPEIISGSLLSILEISSGLNKISSLNLSMNYKYVISLVATSFGGICGIMQTISIIKNKLSITKYIIYKIIAAIYTLILSVLSLLFI